MPPIFGVWYRSEEIAPYDWFWNKQILISNSNSCLRNVLLSIWFAPLHFSFPAICLDTYITYTTHFYDQIRHSTLAIVAIFMKTAIFAPLIMARTMVNIGVYEKKRKIVVHC